MVKKNKFSETEKTSIVIRLERQQVFCDIDGNRETLIEGLATLMSDQERNRDSFRNIMEEAMHLLMLENIQNVHTEQKLAGHDHPEDIN